MYSCNYLGLNFKIEISNLNVLQHVPQHRHVIDNGDDIKLYTSICSSDR